MNYLNEIVHTINYGDNLYILSTYYNTAIEHILANNRHIDPYNLKIGDHLRIFPNTLLYDYSRTVGISNKVKNLSDEMNTLWEQHVFWTRLLLISIAENLEDLKATQARLLRNPRDIANLYSKYYGSAIANKIDQLLTEHLLIGAQLIVALKNGETNKTKELDIKWHKNADDIASAFSSINKYYDKNKVQKMLYDHLELTTQEVSARLQRNFVADIAAFDIVEKEALMMAQYFTDGIVLQFPNMF